jgi:hypothetical protein
MLRLNGIVCHTICCITSKHHYRGKTAANVVPLLPLALRVFVYILCVHQALKRSLQTLELVDGNGIKRARKGSATATATTTSSAVPVSPVSV